MKSRISFFNLTALGKDITRFAPLWILYLVSLLILTPGISLWANARNLKDALTFGLGWLSLMNLFYAPLCAQLLFGDLFQRRLCNALHAMPLRREGWFLTHTCSGLLFSLVPYLILTLTMTLRLSPDSWHLPFLWLCAMSLSFLFYFGVSVLSVLCSGNRFAAILVYGIINFLSTLILLVVQVLYIPLLYGITANEEAFFFFCPAVQIPIEFLYEGNGWPYLIGTAVVGVMILVAALLLYRKRKLETAGDFLSVKTLNPVFAFLFTIAAGMFVHCFVALFLGEEFFLFLAIGIVVGYITGQMLLRRTLRVWKVSTFVGLAIVLVVVFGSIGLTRLDPMGITTRIPETEEVSFVQVYSSTPDESYRAASKEEIDHIRQLHQQNLTYREQTLLDWGTIHLDYTLENGDTLKRTYRVPINTSLTKGYAQYLSKAEAVLGSADVENLVKQIRSVEFFSAYAEETFFISDKEDIRALINAVITDCGAGTMAQDWSFRNGDTKLYLDLDLGNNYRSIHVGTDCVNTLTWLEAYTE